MTLFRTAVQKSCTVVTAVRANFTPMRVDIFVLIHDPSCQAGSREEREADGQAFLPLFPAFFFPFLLFHFFLLLLLFFFLHEVGKRFADYNFFDKTHVFSSRLVPMCAAPPGAALMS